MLKAEVKQFERKSIFDLKSPIKRDNIIVVSNREYSIDFILNQIYQHQSQNHIKLLEKINLKSLIQTIDGDTI
jgi:hypothetical protein